MPGLGDVKGKIDVCTREQAGPGLENKPYSEYCKGPAWSTRIPTRVACHRALGFPHLSHLRGIPVGLPQLRQRDGSHRICYQAGQRGADPRVSRSALHVAAAHPRARPASGRRRAGSRLRPHRCRASARFRVPPKGLIVEPTGSFVLAFIERPAPRRCAATTTRARTPSSSTTLRPGWTSGRHRLRFQIRSTSDT